MIADHLYNSNLYENTHPRLKAAFAFLEAYEQEPLPPGRYDIDGDDIFANVMAFETEDEAAFNWENHQQYIDIHYVRVGREADAVPLEPYSAENDVSFFKGLEGSSVLLSAGEFMVLYPEDIHKPKCRVGASAPVEKVVMKVRL